MAEAGAAGASGHLDLAFYVHPKYAFCRFSVFASLLESAIS
jgi:hypothetical protein